MDIARTQFDRLLDDVIDSTHDRRAAGQVPQIIHAVVDGSDLAIATDGGRLATIKLVA